jgi:HEAT repeats
MGHGRMLGLAVAFAAMMGTLVFGLCAQTDDSVLAQIERLAALGTRPDPALNDSIVRLIEANPKGLARLLLPKLNGPSATESQLATYAWALGWAKDPLAIDGLMTLHGNSRSDWVRSNCLRALAMIGGQKAGDFILSVLDGKTDPDERYDLLDLLAGMPYEPALSRAGEVLRVDFDEYYWKPIFIFGKMGDKSIPFLLAQLDSEDRNVRAHVIHLLGKWLMAPEAVKPLQERFWKEKDSSLQIMILSAIERAESDLGQWKSFFGQVKAKAQDPSAVKFADETLGSIEKTEASVVQFVGEKKASRPDFDREYAKLFGSAGKEGDYRVLGRSSSLEDEPRLKKLRERILDRGSDESFYDYEKVNRIIAFNRIAAKMDERR